MSKFISCLCLMSVLTLSSCTYSITMVHTQGEAQDVVDETDTVTPSTSVTVPVSATGLPSLSSMVAK